MRFILTLASLLAFTCLFQSLTAQGCAPDETPPVPDAGAPLPPNFNEIQKALASDGAYNDYFGFDVAVSGDMALVGAPYESDGLTTYNGAAYIYKRNSSGNWTEVQKLLASDKAYGDLFGVSVSISEDYAVIGAQGSSDDTTTSNGAAYVFERNALGTWVEVQKLLASDNEDYASFGNDVSVSGDYIIVGSKNVKDSVYSSQIGAVYFFERDALGTWSEVQQLYSSDGIDAYQFGHTVSISGNYAIVGDYSNYYAPNYLYYGNGAAYLIERDPTGTWTEVQKLVPSDLSSDDEYGRSVSISGDYAIVGAAGESDGSTYSNGAAYIFKRDATGAWNEDQKILASDKERGENFGASVSISGDLAIVGARSESGNGIYLNGAAYLYKYDLTGTWTEVQKMLASDKEDYKYFGTSVSIAGDYAVVGTPLEDSGTVAQTGAAYFFEKEKGWSLPLFQGQYCGLASINLTTPTATDNCAGSLTATTSDPTSYSMPGAYTVNWTFDDGNGNSTTQIQEVIIEADLDAPVPDAGSPLPRDFNEIQKLMASDKTSGDRFGISVSVDSNYAIIGAQFESDNGTSQNGAAYIYERNSSGVWTEVQKLLASDKANYAYFGESVSISGEYAIVGTPRDGSSNYGAVYVFHRDPTGTWTEVQKLQASDRANYEYFGTNISISGDYLVVGNPRKSTTSSFPRTYNNGVAYIFERDQSGNWAETQILIASDRASYDEFGSSVSISGGQLIVGAIGVDTRSGFPYINNHGAAYIFERDASGSWVEAQKLIASDKAEYDDFGRDVAISGNRVIVGAPNVDDESNPSVGLVSGVGSVYFFEPDNSGNWIEVGKLLPATKVAGGAFGQYVSIWGDYAVAGTKLSYSSRTGAINLMERDFSGNWIVKQEFSGGIAFGSAVSISGEHVLIGEHLASGSEGAAYFFKKDDEAWELPAAQDMYCGANSMAVVAPTATDNCRGSLTATTSDPTTFSTPGIYDITWTFDDGNGNSLNQLQKVFFSSDKLSPVPDAGTPLSSNLKMIQKALASDKGNEHEFGSSVSVSGDYAIIGAPLESDGDTYNNGAAYMYKRDVSGTWIEMQKLLASDKASYEDFGRGVAIDGDYAFVGAPTRTSSGRVPFDYGTVYVFKRNASDVWVEVQILTTSQPGSTIQNSFGENISISGEYAIIGADGQSEPPYFFNGAAYIFKRDASGTWNEVQKLLASDLEYYVQVGQTVSISGKYAMMGSIIARDGKGLQTGAAYVFECDSTGTWLETQKLLASDIEPSDFFASSISIDGDHAIIGADYETDSTNSYRGAAYVFNRDSAGVWVETQKLHGLDRSWDRFGSSVSISGNKALIGAYAKSDTSIYSHGAAYLFERDASGTWAEAQKLEAPDKQQYAYYGISVSISGANAIVGAERTSDGGTSRNGSAYFYGDDADWELPALVTSCNASNLPAPTATDNCAGSITAVPLGNTSFSGPGQHFVTWVFDDGNGNITNQVQEINISSSISTRMQAMPANVCPGGKVDLTSLLRDYSMSIRQVAFYDDDPAQGGQQVGTCRMFRGQARPGSNVMVQPAYTHTYWAVFDGAGSCSEYLPIPVTVKTNCVIYPTVIAKLEGAYNPSSGNMRTGLNSANLIPVQEPYTGLGYTFTGGGGESMTIAAQNNSNVVDWVIVELRDTANSATVVHSRAALLLSNGYIVDVDGINPPQMSVNANQPYYVAVIHRNHLGVMTSAPIYPWQVADFSSPNMSVYGGQNARVIQQGAALMGAGDADGNGQVQNTDDILEWMPSAGTSGYKSGDYNLDGQVQNSERVSFWMQNTGRGSAVPK